MRQTTNMPLITGAVLLAALLASVFPGLGATLVFDRAAIWQGAFWRVVTGNFVHFTPTHLLFDGVAFGVAAGLIEWRDRRRLAWLCLGTAVAVGAAVMACAPAVRFFGGLSGLAVAAMAWLAVASLGEPGRPRAVGLLILAALMGKIGLELSGGRPWWVGWNDASLVALPLVHVTGVLCGALASAAWLSQGRRSVAGRTAPDHGPVGARRAPGRFP